MNQWQKPSLSHLPPGQSALLQQRPICVQINDPSSLAQQNPPSPQQVPLQTARCAQQLPSMHSPLQQPTSSHQDHPEGQH
jgi:hypothetical protein